MKLLFAGTPAPAVPTLRRLAADHDIVTVITRPDAPIGRKRIFTPSPVAAEAERLGVDVIKTTRLTPEVTASLLDTDIDAGVIVAYGALVREPLLSHPRFGWLNVHFSLLPRWRGAAPVQRAVMERDAETGVTVMALAEGLDTGDVYATERVAIEQQTSGQLLGQLAERGARLLADVLDRLGTPAGKPTPQRGEPSYAEKLTREDGRIDWNRPRSAVMRHLQGVTPKPGAFTTSGTTDVKLLEFGFDIVGEDQQLPPGQTRAWGEWMLVGTGDDPVLITSVQPAGKRPMPAGAWLRGAGTPRLGAS